MTVWADRQRQNKTLTTRIHMHSVLMTATLHSLLQTCPKTLLGNTRVEKKPNHMNTGPKKATTRREIAENMVWPASLAVKTNTAGINSGRCDFCWGWLFCEGHASCSFFIVRCSWLEVWHALGAVRRVSDFGYLVHQKHLRNFNHVLQAFGMGSSFWLTWASFVTLVVAVIVTIIGLATPYWATSDFGTDYNEGLWEVQWTSVC